MSALSEQEFRITADQALDAARRSLLPLADSDGFEVELQNGVLNVVFEEPSDMKFEGFLSIQRNSTKWPG